MSLNKNILSKNYYIVVPYFALESGNEKMDKEESQLIGSTLFHHHFRNFRNKKKLFKPLGNTP